jgi:hypothetical protein
MPHYDIIGDVHGYANLLEELLKKIGYSFVKGYYTHPKRKAIFLGDLIDRGNENFKTLEIVKAMVDNRQAYLVLGNHEFNSLCYHTLDLEGNYLRAHNYKNYIQHKETLKEIKVADKGEWELYLEWFRRIPLFLEIDGIRAVHACWDQKSIHLLGSSQIRDKKGRLTDKFLILASKPGSDLYMAADILLKGKEINLPKDHPGILDKDRILRKKVRLKWWLTKEQWKDVDTYDQITVTDKNNIKKLKDIKIPDYILKEVKPIEERLATPVFFGHYWFSGLPTPQIENMACLDYSVAKGGHLVCYRWDGESILEGSKFIRI